MMILSLIASGADVKVTSGVSGNEVSHTTLPVSLSVAMMRAGVIPAPEMTRLPHKAAPRLRSWRSCLGSIRQTMRGHLATAVRAALAREKVEQDRLVQTEDWTEGVRATAERRDPEFVGR